MPTTTPSLVITDRAVQSTDGITLTTQVPSAQRSELDAYHALMDAVSMLALTHQLTPPEAFAWLRRILANLEADTLAAVATEAEPIERDSDDYGCPRCCSPDGCPHCRPWPGTHRYLDPKSPY